MGFGLIFFVGVGAGFFKWLYHRENGHLPLKRAGSELGICRQKKEQNFSNFLFWFPNNCIFKGWAQHSLKKSIVKTRKTVSFPNLIISVQLLMLDVQKKAEWKAQK